MKRIFLAIMFLAAAMLQNAMAQTADMRRNIGLDSLMVIFQQHSPQKVYYISDDASKNFTFTINAASRQIKSDIQQALKEKGYSVSYAEGLVFVIRGAGIKDMLPSGYYIAGLRKDKMEENVAQQNELQEEEQGDVFKMLQGGKEMATSSSKVYQIGEKDNA